MKFGPKYILCLFWFLIIQVNFLRAQEECSFAPFGGDLPWTAAYIGSSNIVVAPIYYLSFEKTDDLTGVLAMDVDILVSNLFGAVRHEIESQLGTLPNDDCGDKIFWRGYNLHPDAGTLSIENWFYAEKWTCGFLGKNILAKGDVYVKIVLSPNIVKIGNSEEFNFTVATSEIHNFDVEIPIIDDIVKGIFDLVYKDQIDGLFSQMQAQAATVLATSLDHLSDMLNENLDPNVIPLPFASKSVAFSSSPIPGSVSLLVKREAVQQVVAACALFDKAPKKKLIDELNEVLNE